MATLLYELSRNTVISPYKRAANIWSSSDKNLHLYGAISANGDGVLLPYSTPSYAINANIFDLTDLTQGWAIELYIKFTSSVAHQTRIFQTAYSDASIYHSILATDNTELIYLYKSGGVGAIGITVSSTFIINRWYHLYATLTGGATKTASIAIDGVTSGTQSASTGGINYPFVWCKIETAAPQNAPFIFAEVRGWRGLPYPASGSFTPPKLGDYYKFKSNPTVDKSAYTPYYAPFLRGGQLG